MTEENQAGQPEETQDTADLLASFEREKAVQFLDSYLSSLGRTEGDEFLLELVRQEREKFTQRDDKLLRLLIDVLIEREVYPAQSKTGNSIYSMVNGWGAYWHIWNSPLNCPNCDADLRDHEHGPPGKREIGIYDRMLDRTVSFMCPDCKHEWSRDVCQKEEETEAQERDTFPDLPSRPCPMEGSNSDDGEGEGPEGSPEEEVLD